MPVSAPARIHPWSSVLVGLGALRHNPLRTILSALGVVIGVGALVAVLSLGDGMERFAREQIVSTTDLQNVAVAPTTVDEIDGIPVAREGWRVFTAADAASARREITGISAVALSAMGTGTVRPPNATRDHGMRIVATMDGADAFFQVELAAGLFFTAAEVEADAPVAVVSHGFVAHLPAGSAPADLLGTRLEMRGGARTIIGVQAATEGETSLGAYVPLSAAERVLTPADAARPRTMFVQAAAIEELKPTQAAVERWMASRFGAGWARDFSVRINESRGEQLKRGILIFKLFLGSIAAISLLVGGIGIMNVLLASVTERTREIGIRKAVGARGRDIVLQFLAESVAITGVGSALGLMLGAAVAFAVTAGMRAWTEAPVHAAISPSTLAIAAFSAIVIGVSFGIYPALRAARLSPIDAIRHE